MIQKEFKFTQHLYLMGDRFDDRLPEWFKGSIVIEHDRDEMHSRDKLAKLMQIAGITMGHKITKLTEVIGGSDKGLAFAKLSGAYPIVIEQHSQNQKRVASKLVKLAADMKLLDGAYTTYSSILNCVGATAKGLKGASPAEMQKIADPVRDQHQQFIDSITNLAEQNFRRILI